MSFHSASGISDLQQQIERLIPLWIAQSRLIELASDRTMVFIGDIHGDRDAVEQLFDRFHPGNEVLVFLGDILDRGPDSLGSLLRILQRQIEAPEDTVLLMGNHEAWAAKQFQPAGFWLDLDPQDARVIADGLQYLPYAAWHPLGVFAAHGALPNLPALQHIREVALGSEAWRALTWGDWAEASDVKPLAASRPLFSGQDFMKRAAQLGIQVMVRSHQPAAPAYLFEDRCLTLFTTTAYGDGERKIARLTPSQAVHSARDLDVLTI